jgi:hypothetical protein
LPEENSTAQQLVRRSQQSTIFKSNFPSFHKFRIRLARSLFPLRTAAVSRPLAEAAMLTYNVGDFPGQSLNRVASRNNKFRSCQSHSSPTASPVPRTLIHVLQDEIRRSEKSLL